MAPMRSSLRPKQPLPKPFLWRPLWRRPGGSCSSRAQPARGRDSARASRASRGPDPPPPPLRSFSRSFSRSAARSAAAAAASGGPAAAAAEPREACGGGESQSAAAPLSTDTPIPPASGFGDPPPVVTRSGVGVSPPAPALHTRNLGLCIHAPPPPHQCSPSPRDSAQGILPAPSPNLCSLPWGRSIVLPHTVAVPSSTPPHLPPSPGHYVCVSSGWGHCIPPKTGLVLLHPRAVLLSLHTHTPTTCPPQSEGA